MLACVQMSPLPQKKNREKIFSEGGETSVQRLVHATTPDKTC